ncbi:hypothetical protein RRG08_044564 [Elysia crispata]|uniref:Uncharacterized protein n=1 Tax=Elysia crispata TaxID=231223 RepID=A0AAE1DDY8_9GAST|nr:hypothetical protein RRG08_044564 [Elysia crispata]
MVLGVNSVRLGRVVLGLNSVRLGTVVLGVNSVRLGGVVGSSQILSNISLIRAGHIFPPIIGLITAGHIFPPLLVLSRLVTYFRNIGVITAGHIFPPILALSRLVTYFHNIGVITDWSHVSSSIGAIRIGHYVSSNIGVIRAGHMFPLLMLLSDSRKTSVPAIDEPSDHHRTPSLVSVQCYEVSDRWLAGR